MSQVERCKPYLDSDKPRTAWGWRGKEFLDREGEVALLALLESLREPAVLALDAERRRAFVAEVKWGTQLVGIDLLDDLRVRTQREPVSRSLEVTFGLISRSGFRGHRALAADERAVDLSAW